jgi:alginate O-acetyltransferase complex protein AlgI
MQAFYQVLENLFLYDPRRPLIFTNPHFWFFFGFVLLVYQFIYQRTHLRNTFLLLFSIFFYYKSSGFYFVMLLLTTGIDYLMGQLIDKAHSSTARRAYLSVSVILNLSILSYFKYSYFFSGLVNQVLGTSLTPLNVVAMASNQAFSTHFDIYQILLPVGISFYTFQSISYAVDIYRRQLRPVDNFLDFAFFVSFFPQLVAGPIVRAVDFIPQVHKPFALSKEEFNHALFLILKGLVKKIVISDYLSVNFVDRVFESPVNYTGFENLMAVYGYAIQIYCDFSGYTDMAIGVALLLGFRLTLNFNSPYSATSITDFWRRWHISLSSWLRDYLYISLGGNRKGRVRTYLNLMLTMVLGGLWHGAAARFILWGALHGVALAFHRLLTEITHSKQEPKGLVRFLGQLLTFHFISFCWIYFRAEDLTTAHQLMGQVVWQFHPELALEILSSYPEVFLLMATGYLIHWMRPSTKQLAEQALLQTPDLAKALIIALLIMGIYQARTAQLQPFIYFQF